MIRTHAFTTRQCILIYIVTFALGGLALYLAPIVGAHVNPIFIRLAVYFVLAVLILIHGLSKPVRNPNVHLGTEGLLDRTAIVIEKCNPHGRVKLGTEFWNATSRDGQPISVGATVTVRDVEGLRLIIEKTSAT